MAIKIEIGQTSDDLTLLRPICLMPVQESRRCRRCIKNALLRYGIFLLSASFPQPTRRALAISQSKTTLTAARTRV